MQTLDIFFVLYYYAKETLFSILTSFWLVSPYYFVFKVFMTVAVPTLLVVRPVRIVWCGSSLKTEFSCVVYTE